MPKFVGVAYSGKRVGQNSKKVSQIIKRESRLNNIGLSLHSFIKGSNWLPYFQWRKAQKNAVNSPAADTDSTALPVGSGEVPADTEV